MELFKFIALVIAGALWSAVLAVFLHKKDVHPIRELLDGFSRLGWMSKVGVLVLIAQLTMFGGAKHGGTNDVTNVDGTNVVTGVSGTNDVGEVESGEAVSSPLQVNGLRGPFLSGRPSQSLTSGEDTASPFLSAQIEFFRNGDFITRSNNVESVYRCVIERIPIRFIPMAERTMCGAFAQLPHGVGKIVRSGGSDPY